MLKHWIWIEELKVVQILKVNFERKFYSFSRLLKRLPQVKVCVQLSLLVDKKKPAHVHVKKYTEYVFLSILWKLFLSKPWSSYTK